MSEQETLKQIKAHVKALDDCIKEHQFQCDCMQSKDKGALIAYISGLRFARNIVINGRNY